MLFKQKFVDESCKIMNESDSEESVENWLVSFSSKNFKKKKQSTIINFADKITTQEQKTIRLYSSSNLCKSLAIQYGRKSTPENLF